MKSAVTHTIGWRPQNSPASETVRLAALMNCGTETSLADDMSEPRFASSGGEGMRRATAPRKKIVRNTRIPRSPYKSEF